MTTAMSFFTKLLKPRPTTTVIPTNDKQTTNGQQPLPETSGGKRTSQRRSASVEGEDVVDMGVTGAEGSSSPPAFSSHIQSLPDLTNKDILKTGVPDVVPQNKMADVRNRRSDSTDEELHSEIRILWPGAASPSPPSPPEFYYNDNGSFELVRSLPEFTSPEHPFSRQFSSSPPVSERGNPPIINKTLPSPLPISSSPDLKKSKQTSSERFTPVPQRQSSADDGKTVEMEVQASLATLRAVTEESLTLAAPGKTPGRKDKTPKRRSVKSKKRYKTLTGGAISLTDDERTESAEVEGAEVQNAGGGMYSEDETEPTKGGRRGRFGTGLRGGRTKKSSGRRSTSVTERTIYKLGHSCDDLLASDVVGGGGGSVKRPLAGASPRRGGLFGSAAPAPLRLQDLALFVGDDLEENMDFEVSRPEARDQMPISTLTTSASSPMFSQDRGSSPELLPGQDRLPTSNSFDRQASDPVGYETKNVAYLVPTSNRHTGPRFASGGSNSRLRVHHLSSDSNVERQPCPLHSAVNFSQNMQMMNRYMFLFPDRLLIAKTKSVTSFKLKRKILLTDAWVGTCVDDVIEGPNKHPDKSLVIGWPAANGTTNVVAIFASVELKQTWHQQLEKYITLVKARDNQNTKHLKFICREKDFSVTRSISVSNSEDAGQVVQRLRPAGEDQDYQLWTLTGDVQHTVLLGFECPYAIVVNIEREAARKKAAIVRHYNNNGNSSSNNSNNNGNHHNNNHSDCHFMLCEKKSGGSKLNAENVRRSKSPLVSLFRKQKGDTLALAPSRKLFGRRLSELCIDEKLPGPILELLQFLYIHGPDSVGVFRKTPAVKAVSEIRAKLDAGEVYQPSETSVAVAAGTLKEYLRALPDCLLVSDMYARWMNIFALDIQEQRKQAVKSLVESLPKSNDLLLRHVICVLNRISEHSDINNMTSFNLATCIGPSLLWASKSNVDFNTQMRDVEQIRQLVVMLIDDAAEIFGLQESVQLFRDLDPMIREVKPDLLTSDSDSMSSILAQRKGDLCGQSHTSLESLDPEYTSLEHVMMNPNADLSPASFGRDSGLSVSNPLLYDDDLAPRLISKLPSPASPEELQRFAKNIKASKALQKARLQKLSDITEAAPTSADMITELDDDVLHSDRSFAPSSVGASRMGAGRTTRELIMRFHNSKSISGDSLGSSYDDQHSYVTSSEEDGLSRKSTGEEDALWNDYEMSTVQRKEVLAKSERETEVMIENESPSSANSEEVLINAADQLVSVLQETSSQQFVEIPTAVSPGMPSIPTKNSYNDRPLSPVKAKEITLTDQEQDFMFEILKKAEEDAIEKQINVTTSAAPQVGSRNVTQQTMPSVHALHRVKNSTDQQQQATSNKASSNRDNRQVESNPISKPDGVIKLLRPEISYSKAQTRLETKNSSGNLTTVASSSKGDLLERQQQKEEGYNEAKNRLLVDSRSRQEQFSGGIAKNRDLAASIDALDSKLDGTPPVTLSRRNTDNAASLQRKRNGNHQRLLESKSPDERIADPRLELEQNEKHLRHRPVHDTRNGIDHRVTDNRQDFLLQSANQATQRSWDLQKPTNGKHSKFDYFDKDHSRLQAFIPEERTNRKIVPGNHQQPIASHSVDEGEIFLKPSRNHQSNGRSGTGGSKDNLSESSSLDRHSSDCSVGPVRIRRNDYETREKGRGSQKTHVTGHAVQKRESKSISDYLRSVESSYDNTEEVRMNYPIQKRQSRSISDYIQSIENKEYLNGSERGRSDYRGIENGSRRAEIPERKQHVVDEMPFSSGRYANSRERQEAEYTERYSSNRALASNENQPRNSQRRPTGSPGGVKVVLPDVLVVTRPENSRITCEPLDDRQSRAARPTPSMGQSQQNLSTRPNRQDQEYQRRNNASYENVQNQNYSDIDSVSRRMQDFEAHDYNRPNVARKYMSTQNRDLGVRKKDLDRIDSSNKDTAVSSPHSQQQKAARSQELRGMTGYNIDHPDIKNERSHLAKRTSADPSSMSQRNERGGMPPKARILAETRNAWVSASEEYDSADGVSWHRRKPAIPRDGPDVVRDYKPLSQQIAAPDNKQVTVVKITNNGSYISQVGSPAVRRKQLLSTSYDETDTAIPNGDYFFQMDGHTVRNDGHAVRNDGYVVHNGQPYNRNVTSKLYSSNNRSVR